MTRSSTRILIGLGVLALLASPGSARAGSLPRQMIYLPLELDPIHDPRPAPFSLVYRDLELPDGRRAAWMRLGWWSRIGGSHAARIALDYVGLESQDEFRYGGGRAQVQWTSRLGRLFTRPWAIDIGANLPTGDESLHPLSAKAPTLRARSRWSLIAAERVQIWAGVWGRIVSPPSAEVRQDPLESFPSGRGVDAALRLHTGRLETNASWTVPLSGLPESMGVRLDLEWALTDDLGVRAGGLVDLGPRSDRSLDHGWSVGVTWRPKPGERAPDGPDRERGSRDGHSPH